MSIISLGNLLNGNNILRMPQGDGDDGSGTFDASKLAQAALEDLKIQERKFELNKGILESLGDQLGAARESIEIERIRLNESIKYLKNIRDTEGALEDMARQGQGAFEEFEKILKVSSLTAAQQAEINNSLDGTSEGLGTAIEKLTEFRAQQEISKDFARDIASSTSRLASKMGIAADFSKTTAGSFAKIGKDFLSGDRAANTKVILGALDGMASPINMVASLLDIAGKKLMALNKAAVDLKVSTGFANDFQTEMTAVADSVSAVGVTLESSNTAFAAVTKNIQGINLMGGDMRKVLSTSAAELTKIGVTAEASAKGFNLFMKTFKMGGREAEAAFKGVVALGEDIGLTASEMGTEFNSAMGYLSSFGKEGVQAFKDLAAQAGVTGIAISKLLGMTKAFDKFSDGAKKAATLNAVLGTSLSSMALMTMNPAERMNELRRQIKAVTDNGRQMTQAQKLFTKEAMGYASVAEMMADLQASPAELQARADAAQRQADIEERMAKAMTQLVPLADQLSMAFSKLATNKELINVMSTLIGAFTFFIENIEATVGVVGLLSIAYGALTVKTAASTLATVANGTAAASTSAFDAIKIALKIKEAAATEAAAAAQMAYGRALLMTGGKVMLFIGLMYLLYKAFTKRGSPMLYMMPFFVAAGIFLMGRALDTIGPKAMLAALALAVLAAGIALVFYGMSAFIDSITGLFDVLINGVDALPIVTLSLIALGMAFVFLGNMATFGSMGIFLGLAALGAMLILFKATGSSMKEMFGAGEEILKIGSGIEKFGQGLNNIKSAVAEIKSITKDKGLFAASISGESTSFVMGEGPTVGKLFKNNKIEVDVKIPDIAIPPINVTVKIGDEQLRDIVRKEVNKK